MAADVLGDVYVLVEHPFEYTGKDGRRIAIQPNERYRLLRRSTEHWWHVRREPGGRPFYLPAQYVRELPALGDPAATPPPPVPQPRPAVPEPLAFDYRFVSARAPADPDGASAEPRDRASSLCGPARHRAAGQPSSLAPGQPACLYVRPAAPVRPAQSLDDLARAAIAPPAGLLGSAGRFKACSVAGSWVCPRPLARSDSENVYEAIPDVRDPPREDTLEQVDEPPEPVYANVERQPRATSPHAAAAPPSGPVWETHTDASTGRPYYHDPDTGVTTWESPFETAEGATGPATSPASVGSQESLEAEWGQYWDEESRRVFFYNPLTGETVWEDEPEEEPEEEPQEEAEEELEMQPCMSPGSPRDQRPPTPETDYPELLTSYPEEDYFPVGSFSEPGPSSPLTAPPGWCCHISPNKQMLYTNHFTQEQTVNCNSYEDPKPAHGRHLQLPLVLSWNLIKILDKVGVLHCTKTVDRQKQLWYCPGWGLPGKPQRFLPTAPVAASQALNPVSVESDLNQVCAVCWPPSVNVPCFMQQCHRTVEAPGLDIDRLYCISGNLATIQKLRYKVDHAPFPLLTLQPVHLAIKLQDHAQRSRCVRDLVRTLPAPNLDTLRVLFQHLCRVIEHGEQNRMSVQSVAIVFGPTLLRPETEETTVPMTMVFQNQVVELILQQCSEIFPPH
ncbi:rho GTPase-activating protein 27-like [Castor canadensis]|uniref:Rho GTPase-activating protein 27-like n=1 Tax=Castor canadensis TaxID=51338 RepID=A0AC58K7G6_CASCN